MRGVTALLLAVSFAALVSGQPNIPTKDLPAGLDKSVAFTFGTDTEAPTITDVQCTNPDRAMNVSTQSHTIRYSVTATDAVSGVASVTVNVQHIDGGKIIQLGCGSTQDKTKFDCTGTMPKWSRWGIWVLSSVNATDKAANKAVVTENQAAWMTQLTLTSDWDGTAPVLSAITVTPAVLTVNAEHNHENFMVTATGSDEKSGLAQMRMYWAFPSDASLYGQSLAGDFTTVTVGVASQTGVFNPYSTRSKFQYAGVYNLDRVEVSDNAGNIKTYSASDISAMGAPISITVTNPNPQFTIKEGPALNNIIFEQTTVDATVEKQKATLFMNVTIGAVLPYRTLGMVVSMRDGDNWIDLTCNCRGSNSGNSDDKCSISNGNTYCRRETSFNNYAFKSGNYKVAGVSVQKLDDDVGDADIFMTIYGQLSPSRSPSAAAALRPSLLLGALLAALVALVANKA